MKFLIVAFMAVVLSSCAVEGIKFPGGEVGGKVYADLEGTTVKVEVEADGKYDLSALVCRIPYAGFIFDCDEAEAES